MAIEERVIPAKIKQRYYICDICGSESKAKLPCCYVCGKHLCENHIKLNVMFSCVYCQSCYDLIDKYEPDIDKANKEFIEFRKRHERLIEARKILTENTIMILKEHWKQRSLVVI